MTNKQIIEVIQTDINKTVKILNSQRLLRDQNPIVLSHSSGNVVDFSYKKHTSEENYLFDKNLCYFDLIDKLLETRNYSLLLYDKSIIQYELKVLNGEIIKEHFLFLKKHNKFWTVHDIEKADSNDDDWFGDIIGIPIVFRIDYDPDNAENINHPNIHFTLSNHELCRIPMKSIISIPEFINFIMHNFYGIDLQIQNSLPMYAPLLTTDEKKMMHINW